MPTTEREKNIKILELKIKNRLLSTILKFIKNLSLKRCIFTPKKTGRCTYTILKIIKHNKKWPQNLFDTLAA